jgi:hypothetical protein
VFIKLWLAAVRQVTHRRFRKKKELQKVSDIERMKNTALLICATTVFVTLTIGIIFFPFTSMHILVWGILRRCLELSSGIYCREKRLSIDVSEVRTASIIRDHHFTRQYIPDDNSEHHTRRRENLKSYEGGPRVRRPPMKWSTVAENLRNTVLSTDTKLAISH